MNSCAVTLAPDRIDIYLRDTREYGRLVPDRFTFRMWEDRGLANFDLNPHCELVPISVQDMNAPDFFRTLVSKTVGMTGAVTLVDCGNNVLDSIEFDLGRKITKNLWSILHVQYRRRWSREEIEEKTWWAKQNAGMTGCQKGSPLNMWSAMRTMRCPATRRRADKRQIENPFARVA